MENKCDLCGKECRQVYIKLSEYIRNDKMVFVCSDCFLKTEDLKASEWETDNQKYFNKQNNP